MDTGYLKKVGIFIISVVLSIGILFYFGYHIWHSFTKEIVTEAATQVTYTQTIETEGYVFRTETVLSAQGGAKSIVPTAYEGEHIRKSGEVAKLYSEFSPDTVARIAEIEGQISMLSRYSKQGGMSLKDTSSIDKEIYSVLSEMRGLSDEGRAGGAAALRQNLVSSIGERAVLTGGLSNVEAQITALEGEKANLTKELGYLVSTVYTPVSGYYYSETDGFENVFKAELLEDITLKELRELLSSQPEEVSGAGKTVTKSLWYLVCPVEEAERTTYKKGGTCNVKFKTSQITISMDVEQVLYDKEGAALILSTNKMPEGFDFTRNQEVELEKQEFTGLKVPTSAVRLINGETGVYILDVTTVSFRTVDILYTTENSYIVRLPGSEDTGEDKEEDEVKTKTPPLRLHDRVITEGKGLYEGRVIGD